MNKTIFSWCELPCGESPEWLQNAHLISWTARMDGLAQALPPIADHFYEIAEHHGEEESEEITLDYGLKQTCRKLTLLNIRTLSDIGQGKVIARLVEQLKRTIQPGKNHNITLDLAGFDFSSDEIRQGVTTLLIALYNQRYSFTELGYSRKQAVEDFPVRVVTDLNSRRVVTQLSNKARAIADGMRIARKLSDTPSADCTPAEVARQVEAYSRNHTNIDCKVLDMKAMTELSMGVLCAVGKGSVNPPCLVELSYRGASSDQQPWVLVGKGITFDSGGLWLKTGAGMSTMKYDMCGAAVVFGMIETVRQLALPINVTAVLALAENMPTDKAMRPGDVVRAHNGLQVEIINTDAEGRLVLADAISYAHEQLNPAGIINIATLTGAVVKALGYDISGVMGNNDELLSALQVAAGQSHDRIWAFPLDESFEPQVKSNIADLCNTPPNDNAIAISAGYFLSKFAPERPWAHLDVSGTALTRQPFLQASGRPIPLLTQFLCNQVVTYH